MYNTINTYNFIQHETESSKHYLALNKIKMSDLCIACSKVIGRRQHTVSFDACDSWQHRIRETGDTNFIY